MASMRSTSCFTREQALPASISCYRFGHTMIELNIMIGLSQVASAKAKP
jgi:hypothetical protein